MKSNILFVAASTLALSCGPSMAQEEVPGLPDPAQALAEMRGAPAPVKAVPHEEFFVVEERLWGSIISQTSQDLGPSQADLSARFERWKKGLNGRVAGAAALMPVLAVAPLEWISYPYGMLGQRHSAKVQFVLRVKGRLYAHRLAAPVTVTAPVAYRGEDRGPGIRGFQAAVLKLDEECDKAEKEMRSELAERFVYFSCDSLPAEVQGQESEQVYPSVTKGAKLEAYPTVYFMSK